MFAPGQKVACVDDQFPLGIEKIVHRAAEKGCRFIPSATLCRASAWQNAEGETALYLVELVNPANRHGIEYGFNAERFRAAGETDEDELAEEEISEEDLSRKRQCSCLAV